MNKKIRTSSWTDTVNISENGVVKRSSTHQDTLTLRRMTNREKGQSGLEAVNRITMIGISIFVISVGSVVNDFNRADLISMMPNYGVSNSFVPIVDPLENIDYQPYGEKVLGTINGFALALGAFGTTARNIWGTIEYFFTLGASSDTFYGSFSDEFGQDRFDALLTSYKQISSPDLIHGLLTETELQWVVDNVSNQELMSENEKGLFYGRPFVFLIVSYGSISLYENVPDGTWLWFYTHPSVYDLALFFGDY